MQAAMRWVCAAAVCAVLFVVDVNVAAAQAGAPVRSAAEARPYAVEYYYKVTWGHFDEFMELYKRNHYPILLREQALGRILHMEAAFPRNHAGEATRWDLRFTIVWRDATMTVDDFDIAGIVKQLYPDQAKFKAEEQRRFALLIEHMDVPVRVDDLATWKQ